MSGFFVLSLSYLRVVFVVSGAGLASAVDNLCLILYCLTTGALAGFCVVFVRRLTAKVLLCDIGCVYLYVHVFLLIALLYINVQSFSLRR